MNLRSFSSVILLTLFSLLAHPAAATPPQVLAIEASEANLKVAIGWDAGSETAEARVVVRDRKGRELASVPVVAAPGETTSVVVPEVLMAVVERHLEYSVTVMDEDVELAPPLPLRIRLDCPKAGFCRFVVVPGVAMGGAIDLDPRLAEVLDASETHDLLEIIARWPELRGAVYTYALALEWEGLPATDPDDCTCLWTAPVESKFGQCGAVATLFENEPNMIFFHEEKHLESEISIEMRLRCTRAASTERLPVATPGGWVEVRMLDLEPCDDQGCLGVVTHDLTSHTLVEALTTALASASASATLDWYVDGNHELNDRLSVQLGFQDMGAVSANRHQAPMTVATLAPTVSRLEYDLESVVDVLFFLAEAGANSRVTSALLESWGSAQCAAIPEVRPIAYLACSDKEISLLSGDRP